MTESLNTPQSSNSSAEVWSTTSYHGAPIAEAEFVPKEHPEGRAVVTDIVDAQGGPQRAIVDSTAMINDEKFVQVTPLTGDMNPLVVKKSELVARRSETQAARNIQAEVAEQALQAMRVERPAPAQVEPFNDPFSNAGPRPQVVLAQGPRA